VEGEAVELKEFVTETLSQIIDGVKEAQKRAHEQGASVNPHLMTDANLASKQGLLWASESVAQLVQFDVALTVKEGTASKGGDRYGSRYPRPR
jgi:hypothetical protein